MNSNLTKLQPYPFERLRGLLQDVSPPADLSAINLSIGEPKHPTPSLIRDALVAHLDGLAVYPATAGGEPLRSAIAAWLTRRHGLPGLDPARHVLPVLGSREALFAFAQVVIDPAAGSLVLCPNPFYQIYEGAALLAGATPHYVEQDATHGFRCDWASVPHAVWERTALVYVCTPGNPAGAVIDLAQWRVLFEQSDRHGFVIASDECYSEIYDDEAAPPLGALAAARACGRDDYRRLMVFGSLSKRSNVPGMRSGYVAGDAALIEAFLRYRTYHGAAMSPPVQAASIAAWGDEAHVVENRRLYRAKFDAVTPRLAAVLATRRPTAGFYLWARVPGDDDEAYTRELQRQYNVLVLPGSYLARAVGGHNPARGWIRIALVDSLARCEEAAARIEHFTSQWQTTR